MVGSLTLSRFFGLPLLASVPPLGTNAPVCGLFFCLRVNDLLLVCFFFSFTCLSQSFYFFLYEWSPIVGPTL